MKTTPRIDHEALCYRHGLTAGSATVLAFIFAITTIVMLWLWHPVAVIWLTIGTGFCWFVAVIESRKADEHHTQWLRELGGWDKPANYDHDFID